MNKREIIRDSGINLILGLWLIIAPFFLDYTAVETAFWNDLIVGTFIAIFAGIRVRGAFSEYILSWANAVLGIWLIMAPFVLRYSSFSAPFWNDLMVGLLVVVLARRSSLAS